MSGKRPRSLPNFGSQPVYVGRFICNAPPGLQKP